MRGVILVFVAIIGFFSNAQTDIKQKLFTRADTLRGSLRKERHFDVKKYDLDIAVRPDEKYIGGSNRIEFIPQEHLPVIQIDLFKNLKVDSIIHKGRPQKYHREHNAVFIEFDKPLLKNSKESIDFYYSGYPTIAKRPPWDGGFKFSEDSKHYPWIAVACQGIGASVWYPNKDHQSDEPDRGVSVSITVPEGLMAVSNGRFLGSKDVGDGNFCWSWEVKNPINNYDVTVNIADYVHFGENYKGLDLDYYVLRENLELAKTHFEQVKSMMDCFQDKFGEYPFKEDGYKLVETPYLGMEHQSAIAYGNKYRQGYLGRDLSDTGIGLKFDFIIVHESGHEWFGNSITSKDIADMWIHESFTTYSESVFVECSQGYEQAQSYINGETKLVKNDSPILGIYNVNKEGSRDMYYKGTAMLNTIRHVIDDDKLWWQLIKNYALHFKHKIIEIKDVIDFFEKESHLSLKPIFYQYLKFKSIPILQLKQKGRSLFYRWKTDEQHFEMPLEVMIKNRKERLTPTNDWQKIPKTSMKDVKPNTSKFFIKVDKITS